jgi:hypothetical protein
MKKVLLAAIVAITLLSSCEVELRDGHRYHHYRGYERAHYPDHREVYNHGYHHDARGGEVNVDIHN